MFMEFDELSVASLSVAAKSTARTLPAASNISTFSMAASPYRRFTASETDESERRPFSVRTFAHSSSHSVKVPSGS